MILSGMLPWSREIASAYYIVSMAPVFDQEACETKWLHGESRKNVGLLSHLQTLVREFCQLRHLP